MDRLLIVASNIYDFENSKINIGGVQTYIYDLAKLGLKCHKKVYIFQQGIQNRNISVEGIEINSVSIENSFFKHKDQLLFDYVHKNYLKTESDLIVLATDQLHIKSKLKNVISIQHGIAFDIPGYMLDGFWHKSRYLQIVNKMLRCLKNVSRFNNVKNIVCVDYNFLNWYRTIGTIKNDKVVKVIPNYASTVKNYDEISRKLEKRTHNNILFARRFVDYRGTILFSNVVEKILKEFPETKITFAGNGPLESFLRQKFGNNDNVTITSFEAKDSVDFHFDYDIAVVPTIFSEGTSLSLNEAMGAGCFPIATHVGGMTNMIIDGFNGKLVYPNEDSLYQAIKQTLLLEKEVFKKIVKNAYSTSSISFSKNVWENRWTEFLENIQ